MVDPAPHARRRRKGHAWQPITDLPADWQKLERPDLAALLRTWRERHDELEGEELRTLRERLIRSWCIETGILERIYTLDAGVTLTLVEMGFDAALITHGASDKSPQQLITILEDHRLAIDGLFAFVKSERQLSTSYVKDLHQVLLRHQEDCEGVDSLGRLTRTRLLRGDWKKLPNNPGDAKTGEIWFHYCPPEHVASEMDALIGWHAAHAGMPPEVEAAWLHHRFTQIHPFQDGNGRVARCLATLVFLRAGGFPLVVRRDDKDAYLHALERADAGELEPLVALFARLQRDALLRALSLSQDVVDAGAGVKAIVADAARRIRDSAAKRVHSVEAAAEALATVARERCEAIAQSLQAAVGEVPGFDARVFCSSRDNEYWFGRAVVEVAKHLGYFANLSARRPWVHLRIKQALTASLVISFHHVGRQSLETMVASAFLSIREEAPGSLRDEQGAGRDVLVEPVCDETFVITARRDPTEMRASFQAWLERVLVLGIEAWRRKL